MKDPGVSAASASRRTALAFVIAGVIAAVFGTKLLLIRDDGSPVPTYDQWMGEAQLLYIPQADHNLKAKYFWVPHNEHRIVFTRLVNFSLTLANRQWDPRLEMTVNALIHAGLAGALVAFAAGLARGAWLAVPATVVLGEFMGPFAWENTLGGFQSQFYFLCWAALGHVWLCLTSEPLDRRWWAGYAVGILGLGTMASGFLAAAAVLAVLALGVARRRRMTRAEGWAAGLLGALCLAGVVLVHNVPAASVYRASSLGAWLRLSAAAFGRPIGWYLPTAVCLQLPMAILAIGLASGRRPGGRDLALLGLGIWCWMQMASLAYGRAQILGIPRYGDLYAISLVANSVALVRLLDGRRFSVAIASLWIVVFGVGLAGVSARALTDLGGYRTLEAAKARRVRGYVATGDRALLMSAPPEELPYSSPWTLALMLSHPTIRQLLPKELRPPLALRESPESSGFSGPPEWAAAGGPARFVSRPLPEGRLPVIELAYLGGPAVAYLESGDGRGRPIRLEGPAGGWHAAQLFAGSGPGVRVVVEVPPGGGAFAFRDPVEVGLCSWMAEGMLARAAWVLAIGAGLVAVGGALGLRRQAGAPA
jgi:hypothetical protein